MNEQRHDYTLDDLLAASRAEYQAQGTPDEIAQRIAAVVANRKRRSRQRTRLGVLAFCGLCCVLLFSWAAYRPKEVHQPAPTRTPETAARAQSKPPLPAALEKPSTAPVAKTRHRRSGKPVLPPDPSPVRQFVTIPYTPPFDDMEQIDVYRVQIPRAAAAGYGVPLPVGTGPGIVTADLVVGGDGVARAIRFIP